MVSDRPLRFHTYAWGEGQTIPCAIKRKNAQKVCSATPINDEIDDAVDDDDNNDNGDQNMKENLVFYFAKTSSCVNTQ